MLSIIVSLVGSITLIVVIFLLIWIIVKFIQKKITNFIVILRASTLLKNTAAGTVLHAAAPTKNYTELKRSDTSTQDENIGVEFICSKCGLKQAAADKIGFFSWATDQILSNKSLGFFVSMAFTSIGLITAASFYLQFAIFEETAEGRYIVMSIVFPTIVAIGFFVQAKSDRNSIEKKAKVIEKRFELKLKSAESENTLIQKTLKSEQLKLLSDLISQHKKLVLDKDQKILKLKNKLEKKPSALQKLNILKKKPSE